MAVVASVLDIAVVAKTLIEQAISANLLFWQYERPDYVRLLMVLQVTKYLVDATASPKSAGAVPGDGTPLTRQQMQYRVQRAAR